MEMLHGGYDGGGLTAMAFRGRVVVSAGRDGGARLWRLKDGNERTPATTLQEVARLLDDEQDDNSSGAIVSTIKLTENAGSKTLHIWVASLDGVVRCWDYNASWHYETTADIIPATPRRSLTLKADSAILDMDILEERRLIACATASGGVEVFSLDTGAALGKWFPLAAATADGRSNAAGSSSTSSNIEATAERARSIAFVPVNHSKESGESIATHAIIIGGSKGSMYVRPLAAASDQDNADGGGDIFEGAYPPRALHPSHGGACVAITPLGKQASGLFVSGAHDGSCRLWDLNKGSEFGDNKSSVVFGMAGYKVWLGSIATDGKRLVSDGRDNMVVVHDFSGESIRQK
jgi:WD40 repeat protein